MVRTRAKDSEGIAAREIRSEAGFIVHLADLSGFREAYFEPQFWLDQKRAESVDKGRGANWFVRADDGDWVLRHYRRGGAIARLAADRYFWLGIPLARSVREWRLLAALFEEGLPVPKPVAARVRRRGMSYCADIITARLADTVTFSHLLAAGKLTAAALADTGRCIRRFHDAQVWHADLNAHNVLLRSDGAVFLIDFDRARRRSGSYWKQGNLRRLKRSLDKLSQQDRFDARQWAALKGAYQQAGTTQRQ